MKVVGLTGGIGSGKSVVAALLALFGMPVYDSDVRSRQLCETDAELVEGLRRLFGSEVYTPDGRLDRTFMAGRIFSDKPLLQAANAIIHPAVGRDFDRWLTRQDAPFAVQETAILFEAGLESRYDAIVCVTAPDELRIRRVMNRNGLQREAVLSRMRNQLSESERMRRSHFLLVNDDVQALIPQVERLVVELR